MSNGAELERLTREIADTRNELDHTLDALGRRMSPHDVRERTVGYVKEHAQDFATSLARTLKRNAIPLATAGVSVGATLLWSALTGGRRRRTAELRRVLEALGVDDGGRPVAALRRATADAARDPEDAGRQLAERAVPAIRAGANRARRTLRERGDGGHPVASVVLAFAAGAAIALVATRRDLGLFD